MPIRTDIHNVGKRYTDKDVHVKHETAILSNRLGGRGCEVLAFLTKALSKTGGADGPVRGRGI